jgi:hypothetical protein
VLFNRRNLQIATTALVPLLSKTVAKNQTRGILNCRQYGSAFAPSSIGTGGPDMLGQRKKRYVTSERYPIGDKRYDLTVYRTDGEFYSEWVCDECAARARTILRSDHGEAYEDGQTALKAHHADFHDGTNVAPTVGYTSHDPRP